MLLTDVKRPLTSTKSSPNGLKGLSAGAPNTNAKSSSRGEKSND